jgi:hypothetical protein
VERCDFSHFLNLYTFDKLPTGRRLREMMDRIVFCIEGWDDDPREIHTIPEIRRFYSAFHDAWPHWLFFCNLEVDTLKAMVFCCLPSVVAMKRDGQDAVAISLDPVEIMQFVKADLVPMRSICERADMFVERIDARINQVFRYFGVKV